MRHKLSIFLLLILFTVISVPVQAQFEGVIKFEKISTYDTTHYVYYVKGDMVRVEEVDANGKVHGIMLVDAKNNKAKSLSPERKLFMDLEPSTARFVTIKDVEIEEGKKAKTIAGYKCYPYTVKNTAQNTNISYYIAKDDFHFFDGMLIALNRKDKVATYYQQIPNLQNVFPFEAVETDMNGKLRSTLRVTSVSKKPLDASLFQVPAGYKLFEN